MEGMAPKDVKAWPEAATIDRLSRSAVKIKEYIQDPDKMKATDPAEVHLERFTRCQSIGQIIQGALPKRKGNVQKDEIEAALLGFIRLVLVQQVERNPRANPKASFCWSLKVIAMREAGDFSQAGADLDACIITLKDNLGTDRFKSGAAWELALQAGGKQHPIPESIMNWCQSTTSFESMDEMLALGAAEQAA
jgi:hypothetical protein